MESQGGFAWPLFDLLRPLLFRNWSWASGKKCYNCSLRNSFPLPHNTLLLRVSYRSSSVSTRMWRKKTAVPKNNTWGSRKLSLKSEERSRPIDFSHNRLLRSRHPSLLSNFTSTVSPLNIISGVIATAHSLTAASVSRMRLIGFVSYRINHGSHKLGIVIRS